MLFTILAMLQSDLNLGTPMSRSWPQQLFMLFRGYFNTSYYGLQRQWYMLILFKYVLSQRIIGGKFNKWIVILQDFDLDFQSSKSKKSLVFAELIVEFPVEEDVVIEEDSFPDEHIFLISTSDPQYGDILIYLQNLKCPTAFSQEE